MKIPLTIMGFEKEQFPEKYRSRSPMERIIEEPELIAEPPSIWPSKRLLVTVFLFLGYLNMQFLQNNLSIALIKMTSTETIVIGNHSVVIQPEFNWDSKKEAIAIGAYSYGFLLCVLGGYVSSKFGSSTTYGMAMLISGTVTILQPFSLYINFYVFIAARALTGFTTAIAYPSMIEILARWIPLQERSRTMAFSVSGMFLGVALTYPCCGYIAQRFGWHMVFASTGIICLISALIWLLFISDDPANDQWISKEELSYILRSVENTPPKEVVHPYKSILTSVPFWALCFAKFAYGWGYTLLTACFPLYVEDMTIRSTDQVGYISAIPSFVCIFVIPITGTVIDFCQNESNLKISQVHKILMCSGFVIGSCLFIVPGLVSNFGVSLFCFAWIKIVLAFDYLILELACIYMAPKHSSVLAGFVAFWNIVSAILSSTTVGLIVVDHRWKEWSIIFFLACGVLMAGAVIFSLFGSTELQPWANSGSRKEPDETRDENLHLLPKN